MMIRGITGCSSTLKHEGSWILIRLSEVQTDRSSIRYKSSPVCFPILPEVFFFFSRQSLD